MPKKKPRRRSEGDPAKDMVRGCPPDWFVEDIENLEPLLRWVPAHLLKPAKAKP